MCKAQCRTHWVWCFSLRRVVVFSAKNFLCLPQINLVFYFWKISISEFSQFSLCKICVKVVDAGGKVSFLYRHGHRLILMPQGMTHTYVCMDRTNWTQWVRKGRRKERRQYRRGGEGEGKGAEMGKEERKGGRKNMIMNLAVLYFYKQSFILEKDSSVVVMSHCN